MGFCENVFSKTIFFCRFLQYKQVILKVTVMSILSISSVQLCQSNLDKFGNYETDDQIKMSVSIRQTHT